MIFIGGVNTRIAHFSNVSIRQCRNKNLGFLLVSFTITSTAATLVPTIGLEDFPGVVDVIVVFGSVEILSK